MARELGFPYTVPMQDFEKLGAFYLGRVYDSEKRKTLEDLLLYEAKDLTTHAVCVGMTGSGKTGLCVSLLEEAAIDQVPTLVIDPKGDLGNLLLTFPKLRASDFRPWVDPGEASRKGLSMDDYAKEVAQTWRKGLADWGQDGARIARLRESCDVSIYTPGSSSGLPLGVLRSLAAPDPVLVQDGDAMRERVASAAAGLLALLGIDADPIRSREHILVSSLLDTAWRAGRDLRIADLIREVQSPPFDQVGVLDLESFYPSKDRFALSMQLNNLLASPGFAVWMEGEPLDIARLLHTPEGRPRISILSIAHLSDAERMFFVTLLLNEVVAWMRTQSGTTSLRALLYMDEVFGYLPPVANPPSKAPMLTLLKQARAFGLGVVLATQNPVDLDYKALSNAGTWFLGRLQTERDQARVLDGLEGASAAQGVGFRRQDVETILAGLGKRVFLLHNVHEDAPVLFQTRWAMSYLRGPLTRQEIARAMAGRKSQDAPAPTGPQSTKKSSVRASADRPILPPDVRQLFLPLATEVPDGTTLVYRPALLATGRLHYVKTRADVDRWEPVTLQASLEPRAQGPKWDQAQALVEGTPDVMPEPESQEARFATLPATALQAKSYTGWKKQLVQHLYQNRTMTLYECKALDARSNVGETSGDFRVRLQQVAREQRDLALEKLRKKYTPKLARLQERARKAEQRLEREESQYKQQKMQTMISLGATLLGGLFGRKVKSTGTVGRATTTLRGAGRTAREKGDIGRAQESIEALNEQYTELENEFETEAERLQEEFSVDALELAEIPIRPRKSDIEIESLAFLWSPWIVDADGNAEQASVQ